jgi:hypothetical protein
MNAKDGAWTEPILRADDVRYVLDRIADAGCCALVGVSNSGKSSLMRVLASPEVRGRVRHDLERDALAAVCVYIDFNLMLEATEQGFYELILRSLTEALGPLYPDAAFLAPLSAAYRTLVAPPSPFKIPLSFQEGLTTVCAGVPGRLVLLFDEFDEPFEQIDERVLLNLRALRDKYDPALSFVTATTQRLSRIRRGRGVDEFTELLEPYTRLLAPLVDADVAQVIAAIAEQERYTFDAEDQAFIRHHADGHLGLLGAVSRALGEVTGEPVRDTTQNWLIHRQVKDRLDTDVNVQGECRKLWADLTAGEQDALIALAGGEGQVEEAALDLLREKGVVRGGEPMLMAPVFEGFVRRQRLGRRQRDQGVRIDVESGRVWVDGREIAQLTELEYRLLLLLYGRLNQVCDKYQVVEAVWGEDYIDEVDDARIDKLVSRLRAKIETDPSNPRYLTTLRGRGYKLIGP